MIFLLTGESGSGKTTLLNELVPILSNSEIITGGFTAPGIWENGKRSGFTLHDIINKTNYPLAQTSQPGWEMQGRFSFDGNTLSFGNRLLHEQVEDPCIDFMVIDEVGPMEMRGKGWAPALNKLCSKAKSQLWVVRPDLVLPVQEKWKFAAAGIFETVAHDSASVFNVIGSIFNFRKNE